MKMMRMNFLMHQRLSPCLKIWATSKLFLTVEENEHVYLYDETLSQENLS